MGPESTPSNVNSSRHYVRWWCTRARTGIRWLPRPSEPASTFS